MTNYKCLVIGYGSIGQRHTKILKELGHRVAIVSRRKVNYPLAYSSIKEAVHCEQPDYIVVANETSEHEDTLLQINRTHFVGKLLMEKPIFPVMSNVLTKGFSIFVGYNLRFHPLIQSLKSRLSSSRILSVQCYVGQYLPTWRPGSDYKESYSAIRGKGGGVLRDLSHELDYLQFLFGEWREMSASGGKYSDLTIDSDDHYSLIYRTDSVPNITLQMNYVDHLTQRFLIVNTNKETYKVDFIKNTLLVNNTVFEFEVGRDDTYRGQHIAVLSNDTDFLCTYVEGLSVVKMIMKAEQASQGKVWVFNE